MAEIIDLEPTGSISLEEAKEQLDAEFNVDERDSCLHVAHIIRGLGQDKQWFADFLTARLGQLSNGMNSSGAFLPTSQVFQIAESEKGYMLRAIVWMPSDSGHSEKIRKNVFVEDIYHDHTFDLLTLSLFGPGYETELYQYDNDDIAGIVGEEVELERQGRVHFTPGRMIFMRANNDIHAQFAPSDISISLNIIPISAERFARRQYRFDLISDERAMISHIDYASAVYSQVALIEMAEALGDQSTAEILLDIGTQHNNVSTRLAALKVLNKRYAYSSDELLGLSNDNALLVKSVEDYIQTKE